MAKKKTAAVRKKCLRLVDHSPIGLTMQQQQELRDLYRPLSHAQKPISIPDPANYKRIALDRLLYIYVETLCHDARLESEQLGRSRSTSLRRQVFGDMN